MVDLDIGEVMVEGPLTRPFSEAMADATHEAVAECRHCSMCAVVDPEPPVLWGEKGAGIAVIEPYSGSWAGDEVTRLLAVVGVQGHLDRIGVVACPLPPTQAQVDRCKPNLRLSLDASSPIVAVIVGREAAWALGVDDRAWDVGGRVGVWWAGARGKFGCYMVIVDEPTGHNKHTVIDQLHAVRYIIDGEISPMDLVGRGGCVARGCGNVTRWLDENGMGWCRGHKHR